MADSGLAAEERGRYFEIDGRAQAELEEAAAWYEEQRAGLGSELVAEVARVLECIAHQDAFATAPIATLKRGGVVRREFVERFP